jgi:hypothetical protein
MHGVQAKYFTGIPPKPSLVEVETRRNRIDIYPILGRHNDTISHDLIRLAGLSAKSSCRQK